MRAPHPPAPRLLLPSLLLALACGGGEKQPDPAATPATSGVTTPPRPSPPAQPTATPGALPSDLPTGLVIGYSPFEADDQGRYIRPAPARLEMLVRRGGEWRVSAITDGDSNVFHKAVFLDDALVTIGGMGAYVKRWTREAGAWTGQTLWTEAFGGRIDRMRDVEVGDLYGDGKPALAIATHDQGVVAALRQTGEGWVVDRLDRRENTFVHEIELGDLDGDGTLEIYATPSEPNQVGVEQSGEVVRYVPKDGEGRTVVADLGNRHAKEIWVGDADGDGRDELYVSVEGLTRRDGGQLTIQEPVEIRRYDAGTAPDAGVVIARIEGDHLMRFLTVGDVDGDGKKEMVAASFSRGLWLLRPGSNPRGEWSKESIDRDSGGFEHASLLADLDSDGRDELYVASDNDGELRRYVWVAGRARREVIHRRVAPRSMITWNLTTAPAAFLAPPN